MLPDRSSARPPARPGSRLPARSGWPGAGAPRRLAAVAGALATGLAVPPGCPPLTSRTGFRDANWCYRPAVIEAGGRRGGEGC